LYKGRTVKSAKIGQGNQVWEQQIRGQGGKSQKNNRRAAVKKRGQGNNTSGALWKVLPKRNQKNGKRGKHFDES